MPVVNDDWLDPAAWAGGTISWGVTRDGDTLRFARVVRDGSVEEFQVAVEDWLSGCPARDRMLKELEGGARLVAGLPPSRVMLRTLRSPLNDARKSREIWPSLLDAALPFPLESCLVAFCDEKSDKEGGMTCLAAAIRLEDLEAECGAWGHLGLDPECMVPEALIISRSTPGVHVWIGNGRSVFVHWTQTGFSACGGAKDPARDSRTLMRFLGALEEDCGPEWVGPGGEDHEDLLERGLAQAGLGQGNVHMNLRAAPLAHPGLLRRAQRTRRILFAIFGGLLVLAFGMPMTFQVLLSRRFVATQLRMAETYREVTGESSPPGQERLLLGRWIEDEWGDVRDAAGRVFGPGVRADMREILSVCARLGVTVRTWALNADHLSLRFSAEEVTADRLMEELARLGWHGERVKESVGESSFKGEKQP